MLKRDAWRVLVAVLALALAVNAAAEPTDSPRCRAGRYHAAAAHLKEYVRCRLEEPGNVQGCQNAAFAKLADVLVGIDAHRGCDLAVDYLELSGEIYSTVNIQLQHLLGFPDVASRCAMRRWETARSYARRSFLAQARNARRPSPPKLQATLARLATQLSNGLDRAEGEGDCLAGAGADAPSISAEVARLVEGLCPICGNDRRGRGEECDGDDDIACPDLCLPDCTCPAEFCGNDIVDSGEECDGTDVGGCMVGLGLPQCGAPGELDACQCSFISTLGLGPCRGPPSPNCLPPNSCVNLVEQMILLYACIPPEPSSCAAPDQCALASAICSGGFCCGTIGALCSSANPCCEGLECGTAVGGSAACCRDSLMPCIRDEDCCNGLCDASGGGQGVCAFF